MSRSRLYIISAPSGCGKGTLIKELRKRFELHYSISCTTRSPREGEIDGVHYYFTDRDDFERLISEDGFLEYAQFSGNFYGTPRAAVEEKLSSGIDVLLEIEPQGAFQVKAKMPEAVMIFILPPSVASLDRRLHRRAEESGETEEQIQKRLITAIPDIERAYDYDYVMINADLDKAVEDLLTIYEGAKNNADSLKAFSAESMKETIDEVLKNA